MTCATRGEIDMNRSVAYTIDLTKINGEGDFTCPSCGASISPEDQSDEVYNILETKVKNNCLEEILILCKRCGCKTRLVGFLSIQR
jgi:hypothetical protein